MHAGFVQGNSSKNCSLYCFYTRLLYFARVVTCDENWHLHYQILYVKIWISKMYWHPKMSFFDNCDWSSTSRPVGSIDVVDATCTPTGFLSIHAARMSRCCSLCYLCPCIITRGEPARFYQTSCWAPSPTLPNVGNAGIRIAPTFSRKYVET